MPRIADDVLRDTRRIVRQKMEDKGSGFYCMSGCILFSLCSEEVEYLMRGGYYFSRRDIAWLTYRLGLLMLQKYHDNKCYQAAIKMHDNMEYTITEMCEFCRKCYARLYADGFLREED